MIRSIPNPPMDRDDVARFRCNLEKHLRGDFNDIPLPINTMCHMLLPKDGSLFMKGLRLPIGIATKSQTLMYLL